MLRTLVIFDGPVDCEAFCGRIMLRPCGASDHTPHGTELVLSGVDGLTAALPALLHEVHVLAGQPQARRVVHIDSLEGSFELTAGSAQLHRDAAAAFYSALPPTRVPYTLRLAWALLLWLLRLPGAARLVNKLRG